MYPTLKDGDQLIVEKVTKHFSSPKRFDIIVFNEQDEKSDETVHYIKRVIGLPGETIQIIDGMIYINGSVYLETQGFPQMENAGMAAQELSLIHI